MKAWLDDFNLHAKGEDPLLGHLETFFGLCAKHSLLLSAFKCVFLSNQLKECGRIICDRVTQLTLPGQMVSKTWIFQNIR